MAAGGRDGGKEGTVGRGDAGKRGRREEGAAGGGDGG